jgi:hypothetical protein
MAAGLLADAIAASVQVLLASVDIQIRLCPEDECLHVIKRTAV